MVFITSNMLFLGAGASSAVNLPTLQGLTKLIRNNDDDPFREIDYILSQPDNKISYADTELDLEIFLTILDSLVDPWNAIRDLGPFGVYVYKLLKDKEVIDRIQRSKEDIQKMKLESLTIMDRELRKPDLGKAKRLYDELLPMGNLHNIQNGIDQTAYNIFDHIATTNYDLVLESISRGSNYSFYLTNRGFKQLSGETKYYLDLNSLRNESKSVHYLKLHGSLDWWERDDERIVIDESGTSAYGEKFVNHIMIYPVYEKYISREPFYSLYTAFRRILMDEQVIVVIGYSFRDIPINNAFLDHIRINKTTRFIISAKSNPVKKRIGQLFNGHTNRVAVVDGYFGEDGFIDGLRSTLLNEKPTKG